MTGQAMKEIRERDAKADGCRACGEPPGGYHDVTLEECEVRRGSGRGCGDPLVHHPYVKGKIPEYEQAALDRRALLEFIDMKTGKR